MNLPQETTDSKGKVKGFWQKITNENNLPNELGIGLIICLLVIGFLIVILINPNGVKKLTNKFSGPTPTFGPKPIPTPTPRPIAKGQQEYTVMTPDDPKISGFKISEFDPKNGQPQTMSVSVVDSREIPITKVEIELKTDHKTKIYPLSLVSGSKTEGEWSATWVTDDTHDYIYVAVFKVTNEKGSSSVVQGNFR